MYSQPLQTLCAVFIFLVDAGLTLSDQIKKDVENPFLSVESANSFLKVHQRNKRGCPYESIRENCLTICDYLPPNCVKRSVSDNFFTGLVETNAHNKNGFVSNKVRKSSIPKLDSLLKAIEKRLPNSASKQRQRNSRELLVSLQQKSSLLQFLRRSSRFISVRKSRQGSNSYI